MTVPMIPSSKLTANENSVPMNVTSRLAPGWRTSGVGAGWAACFKATILRQPSKVNGSGQEYRSTRTDPKRGRCV